MHKNKSKIKIKVSNSSLLVLPLILITFLEPIILFKPLNPGHWEHIISLIFKHFWQELVWSDDKDQNDTDDLLVAGLVVEVQQWEAHCDDFSCCDNKRHNVLLELLDHSVDKNLAHKC